MSAVPTALAIFAGLVAAYVVGVASTNYRAEQAFIDGVVAGQRVTMQRTSL